jgi:hypothetical protein
MKMIRFSNKPHHQGSTLAITLIICGILGTLMGSYLYLVQTQRLSVARAQAWNRSVVVAEAGVEEAMALLNSGVSSGNFGVFPWTSAGGGVFTTPTNRTEKHFGTDYYEVSVTNGLAGANPVILSKGRVVAPDGSSVLMRTLRVATKSRPTFPVKAPMIVLQSFNANGNNVATDSFDSTAGGYDPKTAGTNGDVVTLTTNANSVLVGNGKIRGSVRTPPGGVQGVTATIGSNGSVGDASWVSNSFGFQTSHFRDDFSLPTFPDATLPNVSAWFTPTSGKAPDGLSYDNLLAGGTAYQVSTLSGSVYVGQANTIIYVTDSISIGSGGNKKGWAPPQIHIAAGASLQIYMAGATASIGGNGLVNDTQQAKNFQYYGLPTNTRLDITGNGAFYGSIYAPEADFNLKGSGNGTTDDFTGASITKSTTMAGNFRFHYDESLGSLTTLGGYDAVSWQEL